MPQPPACTQSLGMVISGPLNTDGSFMSFQMYRSGVDPLYWSSENLDAHHSRTARDVTSRYELAPGQHQPSNSAPVAVLTKWPAL